ncbi:hypothetical protein AY599_25985 [Leptolyngbya valderiana BDU 20041]|nr:hypothetical protein AY599_25985 [Leptolyngbya valderiana BDU 20041]
MVTRTYTYTLGGGQAPEPGPLTRLKVALMMGVLVVIGAVVLAGIVALGLVLLPFALIAGIVGWFVIRHRIRQAIRAMESPREDTSGRENVRVRRSSEGPAA